MMWQNISELCRKLLTIDENINAASLSALNFVGEELFWIIQLQCVKLHRDLCWPLASKLAEESTCFHHYGIKSTEIKIGVLTIEILKNLLAFQKIDIWSKDAIIDCIFVATNISLQVVWFYLEYSGSQTKIWSLLKVSTIVVTQTQWIILFI